MTDVTTACPCPGTPHPDGDTVTLRDKLGLRAGSALQSEILLANAANAGDADIIGILSEAYLVYGVEAWTLTDETGKPVPVTGDTIRAHLLSDFALAIPVANAADDLYREAVVAPLLVGASTSSPRTSTNGSTSARTTKRPQKRSRRSSTTTTRTDGIAPITKLPVGDSSSLPSSASAAR